MSAVKIGSVPNRSATVVAVVKRSAYTNPSWLANRTPVDRTMSGRSLRPTRSEPSHARVIPAKINAAHAYRTAEYASGWKP